MTQYELPDGFHPIASIPNKGEVIVFYANGRCETIDVREKAYSDWERAGWAPIVPLKKKARFVVKEFAGGCGPYVIHDDVEIYRIAERIPTESAAQRIADIYNEVMP